MKKTLIILYFCILTIPARAEYPSPTFTNVHLQDTGSTAVATMNYAWFQTLVIDDSGTTIGGNIGAEGYVNSHDGYYVNGAQIVSDGGVWTGAVITTAKGGFGASVAAATGIPKFTAGTLSWITDNEVHWNQAYDFATTTHTTLLHTSAQGGLGADTSDWTNGDIIVMGNAGVATKVQTATAGKILQAGGAGDLPAYSTSTFPSSAGSTVNKVIKSDGTNYVLSGVTLPITSAATAGKMMVSDGSNWVASTPTYPNASATAGKFMRSDGTNFVASTSTITDTFAAGTIPYASSANTITALAAPGAANMVPASSSTTAFAWTATPQVTRIGLGITPGNRALYAYANTASTGVPVVAILQDNATTTDVALLVKQDGPITGFEVNQANASGTGFWLYGGAGAWNTEYVKSIDGDRLQYIYRNLAAATTDDPMVQIVQDYNDDDQAALYIRHDGTGNFLTCYNGTLTSNVFTVSIAGAVGCGTITGTSTITGTQVNGTTSINTGAGTGTARIDVNGNLTNILSATKTGKTIETPTTVQITGVSSQIAATAPAWTVAGLSPDDVYTLTSTPTIAAGTAGQIIIITNRQANAVTVQDESGLTGSLLQLGAATRAIGRYSSLMLMFEGTYWQEIAYIAN